jgi:hypothetical protein
VIGQTKYKYHPQNTAMHRKMPSSVFKNKNRVKLSKTDRNDTPRPCRWCNHNDSSRKPIQIASLPRSTELMNCLLKTKCIGIPTVTPKIMDMATFSTLIKVMLALLFWMTYENRQCWAGAYFFMMVQIILTGSHGFVNHG